jgi:hypothetical protein
MSYDLHGGLDDLSGDPITESDLPLPEILGRLHHARRVRTATYSAVGVAAVAVFALGVVASGLVRTPDEIPPVEDNPEDSQSLGDFTYWTPPTSTSTPTPTSGATPGANPGLRCGSTVDLFTPLLEVSDEYTLALTTRLLEYGPQVTDDPAEPFRLTIGVISFPNAQEIASARVVDVMAGHGEDTAWTVDGVLAGAPRPVSHPSSPVAEAFGVAADVELVSCDGTPLDGDTYKLAATVEITRVDGSVVSITRPFWAYIGDEPAGEPERYPPAQESGDPAWVTSTARIGLVGLPGCGEAYSRGPIPGAGLGLTSTPTFSYQRVMAPVTLQNTGLDIADGVFVGPFLTVTQGGVVVGQTQDIPTIAWALKGWTSGDTVSIIAGLLDSACEPMDAALPPGDYQVWAMVTVWTEPDVDGTPQFFYGGPWAVTIPDPNPAPPPTPDPSPAPPPTPDPAATEAPVTGPTATPVPSEP